MADSENSRAQKSWEICGWYVRLSRKSLNKSCTTSASRHSTHSFDLNPNSLCFVSAPKAPLKSKKY
jgi:hypothetical protein